MCELDVLIQQGELAIAQLAALFQRFDLVDKTGPLLLQALQLGFQRRAAKFKDCAFGFHDLIDDSRIRRADFVVRTIGERLPVELCL